MSRTIWTRYAREEDFPQMIEWAAAIKDLNLADPEILKYEKVTYYAAFRQNGKILGYMPAQLTVTLESLAPNPEASEDEWVLALKSLIQAVVHDAEREGIREIYFVCKDERVVKIAKKHGFTEIPWTVLSLDVRDLEADLPIEPSAT